MTEAAPILIEKTDDNSSLAQGLVPTEQTAKVSIHLDLTAVRAVEACGGTYTTAEADSRYAEGHSDALHEAALAVKPFDERMADLLDAAKDALQCYDALLDDFRMGDPEILKALSDAIDKATGAA